MLLTLTRSIEWHDHSLLSTLTGGKSLVNLFLTHGFNFGSSYAYEEKDVVVLRKEFPDSPFHWSGF